MTQKLHTLLSILEKVKSLGNGKYKACCPVPDHDDKVPSLGVTLFDNDKIGINCWSGCSVVEIVTAVGLKLSDLMPESVDYKKGSKPPRFNKYELFELILHHALILEIAMGDLLNSKSLSDTDLSTVIFARDSIENIAREVR